MTGGEQPSEPSSSALESARSPSMVVAWHPLTPRGVAAFAQAGYGRLMILALVLASLAAILSCWFVLQNVYPALEKAALKLPQEGMIHSRELVFPGDPPALLVEERILGIQINLVAGKHPTLASEFQVTLRRYGWQICSLMGCLPLDYPEGYIVELNQKAWVPGLEAWKLMSIGLLFVGMVAYFMVCWHFLATAMFLIPWTFAYYTDRRLTWGSSWKLSFASLMPGALLMAGGILFYGLGWIDLVRFSLLSVLHLLLPIVVLYLSLHAIPKKEESCHDGINPFSPPRITGEEESRSMGDSCGSKNPFA